MDKKKSLHLYHLISIVGFLVFITTLYGVFNSYSPVPYWDQWDGYLNFYIKLLEGDSLAWWKQHNEHRIVFSRLLFWLDIKYFSGKSYFLLLCNIVLQCVNLLMIFYVSKNAYKHDRASNLFIFGVISTGLFAWGQHENFTWGFQSQFLAVYTFSLAAFICIVTTKNSQYKTLLLISSCVFAVGSTISMANGLLVFPLLVLLVLLLRLPWAYVLVVSLVGTVSYILYFQDYVSPSGHSSVSNSLVNHPVEVFEYLLLYIGSPFYVLSGSKLVGQISGGVLIFSSGLFGIGYFRNGKKNHYRLVLLIFILFIGGTALATAAGRINFGLGTALSSRYMTPAYLAWVCFSILMIGFFNSNKINRTMLFFCVTIVLSGTLIKQKNVFNDFSELKFRRNMAISSLYAGAKDDAYLSYIYPNSERLIAVASKAKEHKLSVLSEPLFNVDSAVDFDNITTVCKGNHEELVVVDNHYYRANGWSFDDATPNKVVFSDTEGKIVGTGIVGQPRPDVTVVIDERAINSGWQGYIPIGSGKITAYAVYDNSLCKIPGGPFDAY